MRFERALPIVPGCKAIVLRPPEIKPHWEPLVGTEVVAVGRGCAMNGRRGWRIDSDLTRSRVAALATPTFFPAGIVWPEAYLLRIDGDIAIDECADRAVSA